MKCYECVYTNFVMKKKRNFLRIISFVSSPSLSLSSMYSTDHSHSYRWRHTTKRNAESNKIAFHTLWYKLYFSTKNTNFFFNFFLFFYLCFSIFQFVLINSRFLFHHSFVFTFTLIFIFSFERKKRLFCLSVFKTQKKKILYVGLNQQNVFAFVH